MKDSKFIRINEFLINTEFIFCIDRQNFAHTDRYGELTISFLNQNTITIIVYSDFDTLSDREADINMKFELIEKFITTASCGDHSNYKSLKI